MGTYLSTPVTEKGEESGEAPHVAWGVVDMQGWRKNMEDAHVAQTDVVVPRHLWVATVTTTSTTLEDQEEEEEDAENIMDHSDDSDGKVFGVFDGHGGPEVARFCQLYIVSVLTQQPTWRNEMTSAAATAGGGSSNTVMSGRSKKFDPATTAVGQALIQAFHAMDRLINDPLRRDEINRLRAEKPMPGERRAASYVPPPLSLDSFYSTDSPDSSARSNSRMLNHDNNEKDPPSDMEDVNMHITAVEEKVADNERLNGETNTESTKPLSEDEDQVNDGSTIAQAVVMEVTLNQGQALDATSVFRVGPDIKEEDPNDLDGNSSATMYQIQESSSQVTTFVANQDLEMQTTTAATTILFTEVGMTDEALQKSNPGNDDDDDDDAVKDDDSNQAVGKVDAAELDRDMMMDDDVSPSDELQLTPLPSSPKEEATTPSSPRGKVSVMFQKLLSISGQVVHVGGRDKGSESDRENEPSAQPLDTILPFHSGAAPVGGAVSRPSAATPTIIHNGRQMCNLPDHPIHAGCTAVLAVLIGRTLTVANAGDSRAVLCRAGGKAEPLSFDHKPLQEREMSRITRAGGFVNQFGRVNGNLNLSRSIGDLKYKQVPGISPADQMITAEPDIIQVTLDPMDEFFILGCDGIWDCLSNEQAMLYVRERIDTKTPTQIGVEMLDEILSEDPRASQGIGGDNMTVMIVDLLPHTRSYRARSSSS